MEQTIDTNTLMAIGIPLGLLWTVAIFYIGKYSERIAWNQLIENGILPEPNQRLYTDEICNRITNETNNWLRNRNSVPTEEREEIGVLIFRELHRNDFKIYKQLPYKGK